MTSPSLAVVAVSVALKVSRGEFVCKFRDAFKASKRESERERERAERELCIIN